MLNKLTAEQESKLSEYRNKWLKIGLCTKPADRIKAENSLNEAYKIAGLEPPKQIIWTTSPLAGALTIHLLKDEKFMAKLEKDIKRNITKLGASVRDSVRDSVGASVGDSVWDSVWACFYGQHEAAWLGFYDFFREVCKLEEETNKLLPLIELSKHSNWVYLYKNIAVISEKPEICKVDDIGRIHSLEGPAIRYSDDFEIFALDGVRISKGILDNCNSKKLAPSILALKNVEQRLVAIKYFGIENLLTHIEAKEIDKKSSEYKLLEATLEGSIEKLLVMKNPSEPKTHYEFVPPNINTVTQALAWRIGWDEFKEPVAKA